MIHFNELGNPSNGHCAVCGRVTGCVYSVRPCFDDARRFTGKLSRAYWVNLCASGDCAEIYHTQAILEDQA